LADCNLFLAEYNRENSLKLSNWRLQRAFLKVLARGFVPALVGLAIAAPLSLVYADDNGHAGGLKVIEPGQPLVSIHATLGNENAARGEAHHHGGGGSNNLSYHGGLNGIGVETAPGIYLVLWGSQWNNNDPSGEAALLQSLLESAAAPG
jgi:hypothetical protein